MLVFLDHQHTGKPHKWNDSGATFDNFQEVELVDRYIHYAKQHLESLEINVCVLSDGHYNERHKRVNLYSKQTEALYVACHVNASKGSQGLSFYDHRSRGGKKLADLVSIELSHLCGIETRSQECSSKDWTKNAFYTIKGVKPIAICYEPFFIDQPDHFHLRTEEGLRLVGWSLARGIAHFWEIL